ncbi:hypothetical protein [Amycolatopsis anabasis]|uniref:hypothetical protein n=1 Tax=Amycolatopsis anabasis TaxID=1840409 RepID=UPI00131A86F8|nr:hypothetical protein [Amycolatopsis anabasis]
MTADGVNLEACADGDGEVRAGSGVRIQVPPGSLVESSTVPDAVELAGRDLGNCWSSGTGDDFLPGCRGRAELVDARDGFTVLRIALA